MANDWFEFKRFTVRQGGAAMKVGTDGTLLGAWVRIEPDQRRILDVGTGTGLLALMAAQRSEKWNPQIDAVEIDAESAAQANVNFCASPWCGRLKAIHSGLQEFARQVSAGCYDHIISNPPYFVGSLVSPDVGRTTARHTASLTHEELIRCAARLLTSGGLLSVVLPYKCEEDFCAESVRQGLAAMRKLTVHTTPAAFPKRILMEFRKTNAIITATTEILTISTGISGNYTEEYKTLTKDFYLSF